MVSDEAFVVAEAVSKREAPEAGPVVDAGGVRTSDVHADRVQPTATEMSKQSADAIEAEALPAGVATAAQVEVREGGTTFTVQPNPMEEVKRLPIQIVAVMIQGRLKRLESSRISQRPCRQQRCRRLPFRPKRFRLPPLPRFRSSLRTKRLSISLEPSGVSQLRKQFVPRARWRPRCCRS